MFGGKRSPRILKGRATKGRGRNTNANPYHGGERERESDGIRDCDG